MRDSAYRCTLSTCMQQASRHNGTFGKQVQSHRTLEKRSKAKSEVEGGEGAYIGNRSVSDCEKNSDSYYSDDCDNASQSLSESSRSLSPIPGKTPQDTKASSCPQHKAGVGRVTNKLLRPAASQQRVWGRSRSQSFSKEPLPPKDLDLVTKRLLSARLLKINELKNQLGETQLRLQQLQKENKLLKQLQLRQERALNKYEDTENEIARLISHHSSEVQALRDRLKRSQERERAAERFSKETQEELLRCKATLKKLRLLAQERHLGERSQLSRKLTEVEAQQSESERKVKELQRNLELSNNSYQRQLAAEKRRTHEAHAEVTTLTQDLERLTVRLKERERELDVRNIYTKRSFKGGFRKDNTWRRYDEDTSSAESTSTNTTTNTSVSTAVQTEDTMMSPGFPSPTSTVNGEDYLSLKQEALLADQEPNAQQEAGWQEDKHSPQPQGESEGRKKRSHNPLQAELEKQPAEAEKTKQDHSKKVELLAKLWEIDQQSHDSAALGDIAHPPWFTANQQQKPGIFSFTQPEEDLAFGGYMPSFGKPTSRSRQQEDLHSHSPESTNIVTTARQEKKSNLMEQLFGPGASTMEILSGPPVVTSIPAGGSSRRRDEPLLVAHSQPAVRAVASIDDEIEELTL